MERFAANKACVIKYDLSSNYFDDATKLSWELFNASGEKLSSSDIEVGENKVLEISIAEEFNTVEEGIGLDYRRIMLNIERPSGTSLDMVEYYLVGEVKLVPMKNSYQTFGEAQILAASISNLQDWSLVPLEDKISALTTAFRKIGKFDFFVDDKEICDLNSLTVEEFNALNPDFIDCIKRAQIVEANSVSGYNSAEDMKRNNILSYTIGETSQMFKTGNTYVSYLSSDTMDILEGYIYRKIRIARA